MKRANDQRIDQAINVFAIITAIIVLGQANTIRDAINLANQQDAIEPDFGQYKLAFWVFMPFVIGSGLITLVQSLTSVGIVIYNTGKNRNVPVVNLSTFNLMITFAIGVYTAIQGNEYNTITRDYPRKQEGPLPSIIPLCRSFQVSSAVMLLVTFPMMAFIFYHKLGKYIDELKEQKQQKSANKTLQIWCLFIFIIQALSNIGGFVTLWQYADAEDPDDYSLHNVVDSYFYFFSAAALVSLVSIGLQLQNLRVRILSKKTNMILAVIVAIFQAGTFFIYIIFASQAIIEYAILPEELICKLYPNCQAYSLLRWEFIGFAGLGLLSLLFQIPFLRSVYHSVELVEQRQTLMTTEDVIDS